MENVIVMPNKRHYVFYGDQKGMDILSPLMEEVIKKQLSYEKMLMEKQDERPLLTWLSQQKMGSYLYAAAPWKELAAIKRAAEEAGFSCEEAQYIGYGVRSIRVFCSRCHGVAETEERQGLLCPHCGLSLRISNHYSSLHDAYLGYVGKL
jgi:hypothetical protein